MKFEQLLNLINEVPHIFVGDDVEVDINLTGVIAIDYCVELWPIPKEVGFSIASALYELSGMGYFLLKKGNEIHVYNVDSKKEKSLLDHDEAIGVLESKPEIDISQFIIDFLANEKHFKYCTEDKCFTRKIKSGKDFFEL